MNKIVLGALLLLLSGNSFGQWLTNSSGNYSMVGVGIGRNNPEYILDVNGTARFGLHNAKIGLPGGGIANYAFMTWHENAANWFGMVQDYGDNYEKAIVARYNNGRPHISFFTGIQPNGEAKVPERMRIDQNGNIGIGTNDPKFLLDVAGTARFGSWSKIGIPGGTGLNSNAFMTYHGSPVTWFGIMQDYNSSTGNQQALVSRSDNGNPHISFFTGIQADGNVKVPERMRIDQNGNVGIGKNNPQFPLDVAGIARFGSQAKIGIPGGVNDMGAFMTYHGSPVTWFGIMQDYNSNSGNQQALVSRSNSGNPHIAFFTGLESTGNLKVPERMRIDQNGNIGIGKTDPQFPLDVSGTARFGTQAKIGLPGGVNDMGAFMTYHGSPVTWFGIMQDYNSNTGNQQALVSRSNGGNPHIAFFTGIQADANTKVPERMRIDQNGNVAIGTTNVAPEFRLSVNGKIRANEIKVYTGWADYVFDPVYRLRPLTEVETYIKENKHLPDVPSAQVVEKEGINVGEMNATLLRKIEELTLYLIEQEKAMKAMQQELQQLKHQVSK